MHRWIIIGLLCLATAAQGAVYRWVDKDGNVVFSDRPQPGAEEVRVPTPSLYEAPRLPASAGSAPSAAPRGPRYGRVAVTLPENDATIRDNTGQVRVEVQVVPALDSRAGDRVVILLDDRVQGGPLATTRVTLAGVDRGTHTLQARVVDANGDELLASEPVTFHMHQASVLFRQGDGNGGDSGGGDSGGGDSGGGDSGGDGGGADGGSTGDGGT
jgi:uncharacterized membrane protein YgcG